MEAPIGTPRLRRWDETPPPAFPSVVLRCGVDPSPPPSSHTVASSNCRRRPPTLTTRRTHTSQRARTTRAPEEHPRHPSHTATAQRTLSIGNSPTTAAQIGHCGTGRALRDRSGIAAHRNHPVLSTWPTRAGPRELASARQPFVASTLQADRGRSLMGALHGCRTQRQADRELRTTRPPRPFSRTTTRYA